MYANWLIMSYIENGQYIGPRLSLSVGNVLGWGFVYILVYFI